MPTTAPPSLSLLISETLSREYDQIRGKVRALVEPLSNEQLWQRPFPFGNSVGHLLQLLNRIGRIVEFITSLADKSELLALNAELEGTRAGEPGEPSIGGGEAELADNLRQLARQLLRAHEISSWSGLGLVCSRVASPIVIIVTSMGTSRES